MGWMWSTAWVRPTPISHWPDAAQTPQHPPSTWPRAVTELPSLPYWSHLSREPGTWLPSAIYQLLVLKSSVCTWPEASLGPVWVIWLSVGRPDLVCHSPCNSHKGEQLAPFPENTIHVVMHRKGKLRNHDWGPTHSYAAGSKSLISQSLCFGRGDKWFNKQLQGWHEDITEG